MAASSETQLPLFGPGPLYVSVIAVLTVAAIALSCFEVVPVVRAEGLSWALAVAGILIIACGVAFWVSAVVLARIGDEISEGRLFTGGVYAWVRNPIYSAFLFICAGALLVAGNLVVLPLAVLYWLFLTVLMIRTEERWLLERFGEEYREYCRRVNRCIPAPPRRS